MSTIYGVYALCYHCVCIYIQLLYIAVCIIIIFCCKCLQNNIPAFPHCLKLLHYMYDVVLSFLGKCF